MARQWTAPGHGGASLEVIIKGKNTDVSADLEAYAERKLSKLTKLSDRLQSATVNFTKNASKKRDKSFRVEVVVHAPGQVLRSEEDESSFFVAIDAVADKLRRQLKKLKSKRVDKPREKASKAEAARKRTRPAPLLEPSDPTPIVYVERFPVKPISTAEAIMQLEATGGELLLFVNDQSVVNCVRKRADGGFSLLVPEDEVS